MVSSHKNTYLKEHGRMDPSILELEWWFSCSYRSLLLGKWWFLRWHILHPTSHLPPMSRQAFAVDPPFDGAWSGMYTIYIYIFTGYFKVQSSRGALAKSSRVVKSRKKTYIAVCIVHCVCLTKQTVHLQCIQLVIPYTNRRKSAL